MATLILNSNNKRTLELRWILDTDSNQDKLHIDDLQPVTINHITHYIKLQNLSLIITTVENWFIARSYNNHLSYSKKMLLYYLSKTRTRETNNISSSLF